MCFIADQIAFDALDARGGDACSKIVNPFEVVAAVKARSDRWIAAAIDRQITANNSIRIRFGGRVD